MARIEVSAGEPLLTPAQVADRYNVDVKTVSRWAKGGKLHSIFTVGGHRRYFANEISALQRGEPWEVPDAYRQRSAA